MLELQNIEIGNFMATAVKKKRFGPKPGSIKTAPVYPEMVRRIVVLRDIHKMTFDQISETVSMERPITKMGVWYAYDRWRDWVYAEGM